MVKTQTDKQRLVGMEAKMAKADKKIAELEKQIKEVRWLAEFNLFDFSKTQGQVSVYSDWIKDMRERMVTLEKENEEMRKRLDELEREEDLFPPDLTEEERIQQDLADRYHRIGF